MNIRIGIIGAGTNTRERHIPGLREIEGVSVVGVRNSTLESSQRAARELEIEKTYASWKELVEDPDIDAVVIGTWPNLHAPATVAALEAGKHVLCEARMAMNASDAHAMLAAARMHPELVAQVVPSPITLRVDRFVQKLIADGFIGEPLALDVTDQSGFIDFDSPLHWRQDADLSGVNTMSLGIWYEAVMRWIGEATEVSAMCRTFVKIRKDASGISRAVTVPDHLDATAQMACGAQAHFKISQVTGHTRPAEVWLYGTDGTLLFSEDRLYGGGRDEGMTELTIPPNLEGRWQVESDFINSIRTGTPVTLTSFEAGVKYMDFTEAIALSAKMGESIPLPL